MSEHTAPGYPPLISYFRQWSRPHSHLPFCMTLGDPIRMGPGALALPFPARVVLCTCRLGNSDWKTQAPGSTT